MKTPIGDLIAYRTNRISIATFAPHLNFHVLYMLAINYYPCRLLRRSSSLAILRSPREQLQSARVDLSFIPKQAQKQLRQT